MYTPLVAIILIIGIPGVAFTIINFGPYLLARFFFHRKPRHFVKVLVKALQKPENWETPNSYTIQHKKSGIEVWPSEQGIPWCRIYEPSIDKLTLHEKYLIRKYAWPIYQSLKPEITRQEKAAKEVIRRIGDSNE